MTILINNGRKDKKISFTIFCVLIQSLNASEENPYLTKSGALPERARFHVPAVERVQVYRLMSDKTTMFYNLTKYDDFKSYLNLFLIKRNISYKVHIMNISRDFCRILVMSLGFRPSVIGGKKPVGKPERK